MRLGGFGTAGDKIFGVGRVGVANAKKLSGAN